MSYRKRRLKRHAVELDITAFMNLIVVLVPFLLTSVVFTRLAVLELNLPSAASGPTEISKNLQLEITIRPRSIEVGDRNAGLIRRLDSSAQGYDYPALAELMRELKARYPDKSDATILSEPDTPYDTLVQVMDAVRSARPTQAGAHARIELFPDISVGDAPPARSGS